MRDGQLRPVRWRLTVRTVRAGATASDTDGSEPGSVEQEARTDMSETIVREHVPVRVEPEPPAAAPADGNPGLIGVPTFLVGSIALGLVLTGFAPAAAALGQATGGKALPLGKPVIR